jgi:hypothetical protein
MLRNSWLTWRNENINLVLELGLIGVVELFSTHVGYALSLNELVSIELSLGNGVSLFDN